MEIREMTREEVESEGYWMIGPSVRELTAELAKPEDRASVIAAESEMWEEAISYAEQLAREYDSVEFAVEVREPRDSSWAKSRAKYLVGNEAADLAWAEVKYKSSERAIKRLKQRKAEIRAELRARLAAIDESIREAEERISRVQSMKKKG